MGAAGWASWVDISNQINRVLDIFPEGKKLFDQSCFAYARKAETDVALRLLRDTCIGVRRDYDTCLDVRW